MKLKKRIKRACVEYGKKHHWFQTLYRDAQYRHGRRLYNKNDYILDTDNKMVIFEAFMGRQYACSPKAIYQKMLNDERFDDFTFIWAFKKPAKFMFLEDNKNTFVVKWRSKIYYQYYGTAKYWITNSRLNEIIRKRDDQVYIQCWHGTPLKRLGYDITVAGDNALNSKDDLLKKYKDDSDRYSFMISPSDFSSEKFASAFNIENKEIIKTIGYPRNDFLKTYTDSDVEAIKTKLAIMDIKKNGKFKDLEALKNEFGIDDSKKIMLYAPTWRDNQHESGKGYTYELGIDFDKMMQEFGDEYIILFRAHYFISNSIDLSPYKGFVYDVSHYDDINELYIISDILITDYSSVFFDYANLKRPIFFYMYDFEEYKNNMRDFYIDLKELPGPICKTEDELISALKSLKDYEKNYRSIYDKFNDKFTYLDDGNASARLIDICFDKKDFEPSDKASVNQSQKYTDDEFVDHDELDE